MYTYPIGMASAYNNAGGSCAARIAERHLRRFTTRRKPLSAANEPQEQTTASGLRYIDFGGGDGAAAKAGDNVSVHYTGTLESGQKFDSSVDRNQAFQFPLGAGRVIKGWDEGVAGMRVGDKRRLIIPSDLGYGPRGAGGVIPPNATLIFEVELLGIN